MIDDIAFRNWFFGVLLTLLLIVASVAQITAAHAQQPVTLIEVGRLFDVRNGRVLENQTILVEGERIVAIGSEVAMRARASASPKVIDLSRFAVLPGLIDAHTHITADAGSAHLNYSGPRQALNGLKNALTTLLAGFTTIRDLGANNYADVALRDAITARDVIGPRMFVSGPILSPTGGHADLNTMGPQFHLSGEGVADGVPAVTQKTREILKYGVDWIKLVASGGTTSKGTSLTDIEYSDEELRAIVGVAHGLGHKVAAHAHSAEGIKRAVLAGADTIEHASFIDEDGIALLKARNAWLVPTLYVHGWLAENAAATHQPDYIVEKARQVASAAVPNLARAFRAGVRMAFGTDAGAYPHGANAREFAMLLKIGMMPMQAIQAATVNAAMLLSDRDIGALEPGRYADVIAVDGDPLKDISVLEHVGFVMMGGTVMKDELSTADDRARGSYPYWQRLR